MQLKNLKLSTNVMSQEQIVEYAESNYDKINVTSVEVFPTNVEIPEGTVDNIEAIKALMSDIKEEGFTESGMTYIEKVPANMKLTFNMCSNYEKSKSDMIIDFGDGTIISTKDYTDDPEANPKLEVVKKSDYGRWDYKVEYTYSKPGKYIVKVLGNNYYTIRQFNLMSRCFDVDLPIAENAINISSFANGALRLLKVHVPTYYRLYNIINAGSAFTNCKNLQEFILANNQTEMIYGFANNIISINLFSGCTNLKNSNVVLPQSTSSKQMILNHIGSEHSKSFAIYENCENLEERLISLIPASGFTQSIVNFCHAFHNCKKLKATAEDIRRLEPILWNSPSTIFRLCNGNWNSDQSRWNCEKLPLDYDDEVLYPCKTIDGVSYNAISYQGAFYATIKDALDGDYNLIHFDNPGTATVYGQEYSIRNQIIYVKTGKGESAQLIDTGVYAKAANNSSIYFLYKDDCKSRHKYLKNNLFNSQMDRSTLKTKSGVGKYYDCLIHWEDTAGNTTESSTNGFFGVFKGCDSFDQEAKDMIPISWGGNRRMIYDL